MRISKQVCNPMLSRVLKEFKIPDSFYSWVKPVGYATSHYYQEIGCLVSGFALVKTETPYFKDFTKLPAYTVAELGVMLPSDWNADKGHTNTQWWAMQDNDESALVPNGYNTQADCYAAILIYLLSHKVTTPEQCINALSD